MEADDSFCEPLSSAGERKRRIYIQTFCNLAQKSTWASPKRLGAVLLHRIRFLNPGKCARNSRFVYNCVWN